MSKKIRWLLFFNNQRKEIKLGGKDMEKEYGLENGETGDRKLRVECFEKFQVYYMQTEITWRTKKTKELFAYLFHLQGKPAEREQIIWSLWPDNMRENMTALFHTTLYNLRHSLTRYGFENLIQYKEKKYFMNWDWIDSDLTYFAQGCERFERYHNTPEDMYSLLQVYRGGYFGTLSWDWCRSQREYLEKMYLEMCIRYAEGLYQKEMFERAIVYLEKVLEINPYREQVLILLMKCYAARKDIHTMKKQYERVRSIFQMELNLDISRNTQEAFRNSLRSSIH